MEKGVTGERLKGIGLDLSGERDRCDRENARGRGKKEEGREIRAEERGKDCLFAFLLFC